MPSTPNISKADSFESINSLESIGSDLYSELDKVTIDKTKPSVKRVLPDLINFDVPSTSRFDDYHTMTSGVSNSETVSLSSYTRSNSRVSLYRSELSLSNVESKTKTEDSYVFEAGYMLNLAARYEDMKEYQRAFESYKAGIEKMLIGVQCEYKLYHKYPLRRGVRLLHHHAPTWPELTNSYMKGVRLYQLKFTTDTSSVFTNFPIITALVCRYYMITEIT